MARKKTEVRVKRTEAWACIDDDGSIERDGCWYAVSPTQDVPFEISVTIIDRRELADLEARLAAAEAENKRLRKIEDSARLQFQDLRPQKVVFCPTEKTIAVLAYALTHDEPSRRPRK